MIKLKNISKEYIKSSSVILKNVSLSIARGEYVSIAGKSGSGKSTLMNILGCLDTPTAGEYELDGVNITKLNQNMQARLRADKIGFIFQAFNLIQGLSAINNVELPLIFKGYSKENRIKIAEDALNSVGLSDRMHHNPSELSGGQQQRVAIARAIALRPDIILADEPTGNLDEESANIVMDLIDKLWKRGHTIVLITHDLSICKQRIIRLVDGGIVDTGDI